MNRKQLFVLIVLSLLAVFAFQHQLVSAFSCDITNTCYIRAFDNDYGNPDFSNPYDNPYAGGTCIERYYNCVYPDCIMSSWQNFEDSCSGNTLIERYPTMVIEPEQQLSGNVRCLSKNYDCTSNAVVGWERWCGDVVPGVNDETKAYNKKGVCAGSLPSCKMTDHTSAVWEFISDCDATCFNGCSRGACSIGYCIQGTDCGSFTCSGGSCTTTCEKDCGAACESNSDCPSACVANPGKIQYRKCNLGTSCACSNDGSSACVKGSCGATCAVDGDCPSDGWYCNGLVRENRNYYCDTASTCGCSYTVTSSQNCGTVAAVNSGDSGDAPTDSGSCISYSTCSPAACTQTTYNDVCSSATQLAEYYASGYTCSMKAYTCSNFEVVATGTDTADNPAVAGTCASGTAAGCSAGAFSTVAGTGGGTEGCINAGACPGGADCMYREYYAMDSPDSCTGLDSCASKTYDPDTNSITCQSCVNSGKWSIGGIANCCGDDVNEYKRTRVCDGYACASSTSDDACCSRSNDCVYNSVCYANGADYPPSTTAKCVSGTWSYDQPPRTVITPNGGDFTGQNETSYTLTCYSDGGPACNKTYYKIINDGEACGSTGFTDGTGGKVTCPFGSVCNKRVCFYSNNDKGLSETINTSNIFHLETNACQGKACGEQCLFNSNGICSGPNTPCYAGGCLLNCSIPSAEPGREWVWLSQNCGRANATKCGDHNVCANSISANRCSTGGTSTAITGTWASYSPPSGFYTTGSVFHIIISGIAGQPSTFSLLTECAVVKPNGNIVYFENWGNGNADFSYAIKATDPEGIWNVTYCGMWSDFLKNGGWQVKLNSTLYQFTVDRTAPAITINSPPNYGVYHANFVANATITDATGVSHARYRWENATSSGPWIALPKSGDYYSATFDISSLDNGVYNLTFWANDTVGNQNQAKALGISIDRSGPSVTVLSPLSGWYIADFAVKARVTDAQGVDMVQYRWENATNNGTYVSMALDTYGNYTANFAVGTVAPGNYTIRIRAVDNAGNWASKTVRNVGIDYISPISIMTSPSIANGIYIMNKKFNITWTGSDAHSGIKCYYVKYRYCNNNNGQCPADVCNANFAGGYCTSLLRYEFDPSTQPCLSGISDFNNYTFFFKPVAVDVAGNTESDVKPEANVTIYIPKLVSFYATENTTKLNVRNGGKVPTGRNVIISVNTLPDVQENINITIYYANHTVGGLPSGWKQVSCMHVKQCNATIAVNVTEAEGVQEVDYYIRAQNSSMVEYLPPNAPGGYFNYFVYNHPICNFLVTEQYRTVLGSNDLVALEVRNIHDRFDNVTLGLAPSFGKFVETDSTSLNAILNPSEEKIIYARLVPSMDGFQLTLTCISEADISLVDEDFIVVSVDMPPNFSELGDFAVIALVLIAGLVYFALIKKD